MDKFDTYILTNFCCGGENPEFVEKFAEKKSELTPEEAIYLVHKCHFVPIERKHEAYKMIMELYPDHVIQMSDGGTYNDKTVTQFLTEYMVHEEEWKKQLLDNSLEDSVYFSQDLEEYDGYFIKWGNMGMSYTDLETVLPFGSYSACFKFTLGSPPRLDYYDYLSDELGDSRLGNGIAVCRIIKRRVDTFESTYAEVSCEGKIIKLYFSECPYPFDRLKKDLGEEYEKRELSDHW